MGFLLLMFAVHRLREVLELCVTVVDHCVMVFTLVTVLVGDDDVKTAHVLMIMMCSSELSRLLTRDGFGQSQVNAGKQRSNNLWWSWLATRVWTQQTTFPSSCYYDYYPSHYRLPHTLLGGKQLSVIVRFIVVPADVSLCVLLCFSLRFLYLPPFPCPKPRQFVKLHFSKCIF